ncbi:MAG: hypothetical protein QME12_07365 [Nanoarchaeota archaeon]|nr:hypothetical protein [Nanoarchaeota archaeon]
MAIVGAVWYIGGVSEKSALLALRGVPSEERTSEELRTDTFCSNNKEIDLEIRLKDRLVTTSTSYLNGTIYVVDGGVQSLDVTTSGTSYTTLSNALACGVPANIFLRTDQDSNNGMLIASLSAADTHQAVVRLDAEVTRMSGLQARLYGFYNDKYMYDSSDSDNLDFENLNTGLNFTNSSEAAMTTIGANQNTKAHWKLEVQTNVSDKECGIVSGLALNYAGDNDANDWQKPTVKLGVTELRDARSSLSPNDLTALNAYEAFYNLGKPIGDNAEYIDMQFKTGSGVDPDFDIVGRVVCSGIYEATEAAPSDWMHRSRLPALLGTKGISVTKEPVDNQLLFNQVVGADYKPVFFRTDSSDTQMATATAMQFIIAVA